MTLSTLAELAGREAVEKHLVEQLLYRVFFAPHSAFSWLHLDHHGIRDFLTDEVINRQSPGINPGGV